MADKEIYIVHGWEGSPRNDWMPWAKKELTKLSYEVHIPEMPDTSHPKISTWVAFLKKVIKNPNKKTILIGHSIGCQTILRYLETLPENQKVDKVILVAGWITLTPMTTRTKEEQEIVKPWFETPIDLKKVKQQANSFIAIFSDNDPYVPYKENSKTYHEELDAKIILQKDQGHFSEDAEITKLPILLELLEG